MPFENEITADDIINVLVLGDEHCGIEDARILMPSRGSFVPPFKAYMPDISTLDIVTCVNYVGRDPAVRCGMRSRYFTVSLVFDLNYLELSSISDIHHKGCDDHFLSGLPYPSKSIYVYANKYKTTKIQLSRHELTSEQSITIREYMADNADII